jgi:hypothetical protein
MVLLLSACAAPLRVAAPTCAQRQTDVHAQIEAGAPLPPGSPRQAQLAALLGLSDALVERSHGPLSDATRLRALDQLTRARIAIAATEAELGCERESALRAADYLTYEQGNIVQKITAASIVTAAAVGVASALLSTRDAEPSVQDAVAIGGAAATAGLGFATLYVSPTLRLEHPRNLLRDIWEGPTTSSVYPPVVWAYLSRPHFSNAQSESIRAQIVNRYHQLGLGANDPSTQQLLFANGGEFDADELRFQAVLLDLVKAAVALEDQDVQLLAADLLGGVAEQVGPM